MKKILIELLGWYGVLAILVAYALVTFQVVNPTSVWFQLLNLTGAFGIVIETYVKKDYQPLALNLVWMGIAIIALSNLLRT